MPTTADNIITWLRANPRQDGHELSELAERFGVSPERLRDQLSRFVGQGLLNQSAPVPGIADANPSYWPSDV